MNCIWLELATDQGCKSNGQKDVSAQAHATKTLDFFKICKGSGVGCIAWFVLDLLVSSWVLVMCFHHSN